MERVQNSILRTPNAVRRPMIFFLIAVGSYVKPLTAKAIEIGEKIGPVKAFLGDNECKIPFTPDYIREVEARCLIGKKRSLQSAKARKLIRNQQIRFWGE